MAAQPKFAPIKFLNLPSSVMIREIDVRKARPRCCWSHKIIAGSDRANCANYSCVALFSSAMAGKYSVSWQIFKNCSLLFVVNQNPIRGSTRQLPLDV